MNVNAANSLLKTLEEPTASTVLLLVTERPAQLPATIRSRCQQLGFPAPPRAESLAWLAEQADIGAERAGLLLDLSAGAPLQALALAADEILEQRAVKLARLEAVQAGREDPLRVAADWAQEADAVTLAWMQAWIGDMIRISLGGDTAPVRNADLRDRLNGMAGRIGPAMLYTHMDRVTAAVRMSASGVNHQLMMEDLILPWAQGKAAQA
jgi:DNA polymerase-3 subunit delta'